MQSLAAKRHRFTVVLEGGSRLGILETPITGWKVGNEFYRDGFRYRIAQIREPEGARDGAEAVFVVTPRDP